jgi:hypothetical protein
MRAVPALFVIGIACSSVPAVAAQNPWCFGPFPVDIIDCKDAGLFALHNEVESLHSKVISAAQGQRKQALIAQRSGWLRTRGRRCGVPAVEWVTPYAVRAARPCLTSLYQARIAELSRLLPPDTAPSPTPKAATPSDAARDVPPDTARSPTPKAATASDTARDVPKAAAANNTATCNPRAIELAGRKCFWEQQKFQCKVGNDIYPSKRYEEKGYDPKRRYDPNIPKAVWEVDYISENDCDDGDMAFFNGLLCAAGDNRGCIGVGLAQEIKTGRWWRSKRRIGELRNDGSATFSTEAGLGVLLYMVKTGDKNRFDPWLKFIADLPRTYGPLPSYCPHKECVFKIIDCPLLVTVASRFDEASKAVSICDPLQYLHLPTPDQIQEKLEGGLKLLLGAAARFEALHAQLSDETAKVLGLPQLGSLLPEPAEELRKQFDLLFGSFKAALERLLGPQIGQAAALLAQEIALVNAVVNSIDVNGFKLDARGKIVYESGNVRVEDASVTIAGNIGYNPNGEHIAGVEVFLLRNLGYSSEALNKAASYAYLRDSRNPFFEYLANGRTAQMRQLMLGEKCPSFDRPSVKRFQWFPERGEELQSNGQPAWIESMYWDCIFLAHLYESPVTSSLARAPPPFDPFGDLANALEEVQKFLDDMNNKRNGVLAWIKEMEDALRPDKAFCDNNPNNELCKLVPPTLSFCDQNPNNEVCKGLRPGETPGDFCARNPNNEFCKAKAKIPMSPIPIPPIPGGPPIPIPIPIPILGPLIPGL